MKAHLRNEIINSYFIFIDTMKKTITNAFANIATSVMCNFWMIIATVTMLASSLNASAANNKPTVAIDTTVNLLVYYPDFSRIDLVCGTMPSKSEQEVVFCAEAAFTAELLSTFKHSNICGSHVSGGKYYDNGKSGAAGCFTWWKGGWQFGLGKEAKITQLKSAAQKQGMGFCQYMIIRNGAATKAKPFRDEAVNEYRCLCEKNGKLCIVDCRKPISFGLFRKALLSYGVKHAIYLDMGSGWNYSWYRDEAGKVHEIHKVPGAYTTNWITFYK